MNEIGSVLNLGFGLSLFWLLYFFGWRPYRTDSIRHELFELRNELFLYAADGAIAFEHPAYQILRSRIEALIRFGHKISLMRLIILGGAAKSWSAVEHDRQAWESALDNLSDHVKEKIVNVQNRVYIAILIHIVKGCPPLFLVSVLAFPFVAIHSYLSSRSRMENELKVAEKLRIELIEEQAMRVDDRECVPA